jgi:alpha-tubulin suppressor-like RCC1 family protein
MTRAVATRVDTERRFSYIDASGDDTWALTADGTLFHWGRDQLSPEPVSFEVALTGLRASWHQCGLDAADRGYCWGAPPWWFGGPVTGGLAPDPEPAFEGFTLRSLAPGIDATCAVTAEGSILCGGNNDHGQLGNGTFARADTVTLVRDDARYTTVDLGFHFGCGLTTDGVVKCWGINDHGQLGRGAMGPESAVPAPVYGDWRFQELSVGGDQACAITTDSQVRCWGWVDNDAATQDPTRPMLFGIGLPYRGISVGTYHACAISLDDGGAYCWGSNHNEQLGRGDGKPGGGQPRPVEFPDD